MNATQLRAEEALRLHHAQRYAFGPAFYAVRALRDARQDARARAIAHHFSAVFGGDDKAGDALYEVAGQVSIKHFMEGEVILSEGARGTDVFVIQRGEVRVERKDVGVVARLGPGQSFGEIAAFAQTPRTASVVAEGGLSLLVLERKALGKLGRLAPALEELLKRLYRNRLLSQLVGSDSIFGGLEPEARHTLFQRFTPQKVPKGVSIVREGQKALGFYVMVSGGAVVFSGGSGSEYRKDLAELTTGAFFGEISLMKDLPATATVETTRESILFFLPRESFHQVMRAHEDARAALQVVADERMREFRDPTTLPVAAAPVVAEDDAATMFEMPAIRRSSQIPAAPMSDMTTPLRSMTCPVCGFDQPEGPACMACGVDIAAERAELHRRLTGSLTPVAH